MVEFFNFREGNVNLWPATAAAQFHHGGEAVQGLRPEYQIDERRTPHDGCTLLARHTATDTDDEIWIGLF